MKPLLTALTLALLLPLTTQAADKTPKIVPLVKVGDTTISNLDFAVFRAQNPQSGDQPQQQITLLNELVNTIMVAESKAGQAIAKQPEVQAAIRITRARLIAQAVLEERMQNTPVSDQEIQAVYDQQYADKPSTEIKARHILLSTEKQAKAVIAQLNKGASFAALAKKDSIGPSAAMGGELGWLSADQVFKPFYDALSKLKDGSYTQTPVHTQFGWHVIEREQTRTSPPPALSMVRNDIIQQIRTRKLNAFVKNLRANTQVQVLQNNK